MKQIYDEGTTTHELRLLDGCWPDDIAGHHWIAGIGQRAPWLPEGALGRFFSPGVLQRIDLAPTRDGRVRWHVRNMLAPDVRAALRHLEVMCDPGAAELLGTTTTACNTALFAMGERLFVTADSHRPWELDPNSMQLETVIGAASEWGRSAGSSLLCPYVPTSAHPAWDAADGVVYNYTSIARHQDPCSPEIGHRLFLTAWDGCGRIRRWNVPEAGVCQYVHSLITTRNFVLLLDSSSYAHETGAGVLGRERTVPQMPVSRVVVIRKRDIASTVEGGALPCRRVDIPLEAFHFAADYHDDGQSIDVWVSHANGFDLMFAIDKGDVHWKTGAPLSSSFPGWVAHADYAPLGRYRIHVDSGTVTTGARVAEPRQLWGPTIWTWDPRHANPASGSFFANWVGFDPRRISRRLMDAYGDRPHRVLPPGTLPDHSVPCALTEVGWDRGEVLQHYAFPMGCFANASQFIPRRGSDGAGWLGVYVLTRAMSVEYWLFDAQRLAHGPVARAGNRHLLPTLTTHHILMDEVPRRSSPYRVSMEADLGDEWRRLPARCRAVVETALRLSTASGRQLRA